MFPLSKVAIMIFWVSRYLCQLRLYVRQSLKYLCAPFCSAQLTKQMARGPSAEQKKGITIVYTCCGIAGFFLLGTQPPLLLVSSGFENWLRSGNWTEDHEFLSKQLPSVSLIFFCYYKLNSTLFDYP